MRVLSIMVLILGVALAGTAGGQSSPDKVFNAPEGWRPNPSSEAGPAGPPSCPAGLINSVLNRGAAPLGITTNKATDTVYVVGLFDGTTWL